MTTLNNFALDINGITSSIALYLTESNSFMHDKYEYRVYIKTLQ